MPRGGLNGRRIPTEGRYVHVWLMHFALWQKLTHCRETILQSKRKKRKELLLLTVWETNGKIFKLQNTWTCWIKCNTISLDALLRLRERKRELGLRNQSRKCGGMLLPCGKSQAGEQTIWKALSSEQGRLETKLTHKDRKVKNLVSTWALTGKLWRYVTKCLPLPETLV